MLTLIGSAVATPARGHPWVLPLPVRLLLVLIHPRINLTTRALAALFATSQSTVDRVLHHLVPILANALEHDTNKSPDRPWIIDDTLIPVHDQSITTTALTAASAPASNTSSSASKTGKSSVNAADEATPSTTASTSSQDSGTSRLTNDYGSTLSSGAGPGAAAPGRCRRRRKPMRAPFHW